MVRFLITVVRQGAGDHLLIGDVFKVDEFVLLLASLVVETLACV